MSSLPVSFTTLVLSLGSSALHALGLDPQAGEAEKDLELARFNIDMMALLREKTKGNLTPEEQRYVDEIISDLQMKFVNVSKGDKK